MQIKNTRYSDDMLLVIAVWMCSLPFIAFLVVPVWGLTTAILLALVLFFTILAVCWGFCGWKVLKK
jgi:hypothetical protein